MCITSVYRCSKSYSPDSSLLHLHQLRAKAVLFAHVAIHFIKWPNCIEQTTEHYTKSEKKDYLPTCFLSDLPSYISVEHFFPHRKTQRTAVFPIMALLAEDVFKGHMEIKLTFCLTPQ